MANIPAATPVLPTGVDITTPPTAAASTMTMANDGRTLLCVKTGATTANLTLTPQAKIQDGSAAGIAGTPPVIALAANKQYLIGPFPTGVYNDANGELNIAFSAVTSITVQALRSTPV
jgi:hypothetical protein